MTKPITLYSSTAGLNTRLDPERLLFGIKDNPGLVELAQAVNVSIDDRGLVTLRNGDSLLLAGNFHSGFCDGGDCFAVEERTSDAAIVRIVSVSPFTTAGVRSGLTKNKRMAWGQSNTDTFYSNGVQNGYIRGGVSSAWPVGSYTGPDADLQFDSAAPLADHIAFIQGGKLILAVGSALFINHEPFQYGLFSKRKGYIGFESDVTMLCPVDAGFFASDGKATWFFRKMEGWYAYKQERVEDAPVIAGSLAYDRVQLRGIGMEGNGFGRIWCSAEGVCLGTDEGTLINLTKEAVVYPTAHNYGASLIRGTTVINTLY